MIFTKNSKNEIISTNALLTSWSAEKRRSEAELQWDLCIAPVTYGHVSILDNMICDNGSLYNFLQKQQHADILRQYAKEGAIQLWHRAFWQPDKPVNCAEDILKNWLCRQDEVSIAHVEFGMLNQVNRGEINKEIRKAIKKWNKSQTKEDFRVREFYSMINPFPDYEQYLGIVNDIFFSEKSKKGAAIFSSYPKPLKYRFIEAIGISNAEEMIAQCLSNDDCKLSEKIASNIKQNKVRNNPLFSIDKVKYLCNLADDNAAVEEFFELILKRNPSITDFRNVISLFNDPVSTDLLVLLNGLYDTGIPDANNARFLYEGNHQISQYDSLFEKEMNTVVEDVNRMLNKTSFKKIIQNAPSDRRGYVDRFEEFGKMFLHERIALYHKKDIANIKTVVKEVAIWTPVMLGALEKKYEVKIGLASLASVISGYAVDKVAGFIIRKFLANDRSYHKLVANFYKYGYVKIGSLDEVNL